MTRKALGALGALLALLVTGVAAVGTPADAAGAHGKRGHPPLRPVIFVHGGSGSAAQFETQAMRLTSNGYPARLIDGLEYDSTFGLNTMEDVWAELDELIAEMLDRSRADQVDLLGHSLGTTVSQGYLNSSPERADKVAHYVNIDGRQADALPGGVDTLAVWGEGDQTRRILGARNFYAPDQSHVQVATSAETFAEFFEFFNDRPPRTTNVLPEPFGRVRLSGKANLFPSNVGADGSTLEIWRVRPATGERIGRRPKATFEIGKDGSWGPFRANSRHHYEFALIWDENSTQHYYFQPFLRSDHLIRLLTSEPGTGIDLIRDQSDNHTSVNFVRYKEWWADQDQNNDVLTIDGQSILNPATSPRSKRVNAIFAHDVDSDGVSDLSQPIPIFFALPFITGVDLFIPASIPPDDTVSFAMTARDSGGETAVINVPNFASSQHHVTVQFRDFEQDLDRFPWRR
jgi:pimeloyl-ACP methyl ester carboxylesterase